MATGLSMLKSAADPETNKSVDYLLQQVVTDSLSSSKLPVLSGERRLGSYLTLQTLEGYLISYIRDAPGPPSMDICFQVEL
jgi:hypothetical protein